MTLREVMHAHIPTLTADSTVRDAVDKMDIYQFPALVLLDADKHVLAVVTEGDVCRAVHRRDSLSSMALEPILPHSTSEPIVAEVDTEIGDAFHRMLSSGLTILPVVEDDVLAGIVLRVDLMQAMLQDSAADTTPG